MAWTAEQMAAKRARFEQDKQGRKTDTSTGGNWTAERMAAKRETFNAARKQQTQENLYAAALDNYRTSNNLSFAPEQQSAQATSFDVDDSSGAGTKSLVEKYKDSIAQDSQKDEFDKLNEWFDSGDNRNLADAVRRVDNTHGKYTDRDLIRKGGWSKEQIDTARQKNAEYDALPAWQRAARRTANTIGGIVDSVAAAPLLAGEYGVQAAKNVAQSNQNRKELEAQLDENPRQKNLYERLLETDMDYRPKYSTGDLIQQGFSRDEIEEMRSRIAGVEVQAGIDPEKSLGYQLYKRGQDLTGAAQSGRTPAAKTLQGVVSSAAENLAVAAVNPMAVLPVLSAQGAAEAMGQSVEKGTSAGRALGGGLAKFGAGWAINSVGAADLAKTMGSDYAKDTLAGQIADWVRNLAEDAPFAKKHPAVASAISGGIDNAMQAFVETYADKAIDAALGDEEAAQTLFDADTFLTALESGLSGGASGVLGGIIGTGLKEMNDGIPSLLGQAEYYDALDRAEKAKPAQGKTASTTDKTVSAQEEKKNRAPEESLPAPATPVDVDKVPEGQAFDRQGLSEQDTESRVEQKHDDPAAEVLPAPAVLERIESIPEGQALGKSAQAERNAGIPTEQQNDRLAAENADNATVENTGENVEDTALRETYGMREERSLTDRQSLVKNQLEQWGVPGSGTKTDAAGEISRKLPVNVEPERYAAAASTLYRLGQMEDVKSFDDALRLAGSGNATALNVNVVLNSMTGRNALETAYVYGKDAGTRNTGYGGSLSAQSIQGRGETRYQGTMRDANDPASQIIELNARATGTDAILKNVLKDEAGRPDSRVRAYVDTELAQIFFGDSAEDTFGTVLHEDYHWYNTLDSEGAKSVQDHALRYLAEMDGYESVDELIRSRMEDYAGQGLTYEQAAEELVADAWRGIFSTEEDFKRWVTFQRGQAEKNAGGSGNVTKVMNRIRELLSGIIDRAKEVLALDPENRAALKAKRLAEKERRILQDEYFAHADKAMENLRAAKENAATPTDGSAAEKQGVRYSIDESFEKAIDELDKKASNRMIAVGTTSEALKSIGVKDQMILWNVGKIRKIMSKHSDGMTVEIIKQVPQVLENPIVILHSNETIGEQQGKNYGGRIYMFGEVYDATGKTVSVSLELRPTSQKGLTMDNIIITSAYGKKNVQNALNTDQILYVNPDKKRTAAWLGSNGLQLPVLPTMYGSMGKITYFDKSVKMIEPNSRNAKLAQFLKQTEGDTSDESVKKSRRFQLGAPVEVNGEKELVAVHNLTEENLKESLELGGMPSPSIAVVKAQEGHTKYGPISLVFGADSIDPMANKANRVYGSDAWTPTRPNVEYEINQKARTTFENAVYEASKDAFEGKFANSSAIRMEGIDESSALSPTELAQKLQNDTAVQLAYLKDQGETVEPVYKTEDTQLDSFGNDALEKLIELAGADEIRKGMEEGDWDTMESLADKAADALTELRTHGQLQGVNERWKKRIANLRENNRNRLIGMVNNAYKMLTDTSGGKAVLDVEATRAEIRKAAPETEVKQWVRDQLKNMFGKKGIRNRKDAYTAGGNRRSFAQLHNAYTLDNLVKAMNEQSARGEGTFGLSANTLMSTATEEYRNLDEVRADKERLSQMPEEEYKALLEQADRQIEDVIGSIRKETAAHADNSFEEREILGNILLRAAEGKKTTAAITKAFAKEGYDIGRETAKKILSLYQKIAKIPTGYFEAKPQRAVGFEEVRAAIVPSGIEKSLVDVLKEKGVRVYEYPAGDDAKRTELLNRVPDVRFQLAEEAEKDAKRNQQRQASRTIADNEAAIRTLTEMLGLTRGVRISEDSVTSVAERLIRANGAKGKADTEHIARQMKTLIEYMKTDGAAMNKAQGLAESIAGEILDSATYRNTELWQQYPEYHELSYTVDKIGKAKAELVRQYGSWGEAVAEARRHGVKLRQEAGYRDGNPAEQYEAIVNDTRSVGGVTDGAAALFRSAAKAAGVDGASSMESTEWLDVLMNVHDAIKPRMMSRFEDVAAYEDAKVELAGRVIGDLLNVPEMTDAQAIWDGIQQWQRKAAAAAAGDETSAAQAVKELKGVQKDQTREFNRRLTENQKAGFQTEDVKQLEAERRRNAKAEKQLNENLEMMGADITNMGDLNERLTFLRESYEREWKNEKKRLREERQQMLDDIRLENRKLKNENKSLSKQVAQEQQRADRAEYAQIVQEREIMEWEAENQRKADEWQQKQAERNAIAIEVARQQRDEDIAIAKALAEKRVQKARDGREMDKLKQSIRGCAAQLNQMVLRPTPGKYVSPRMIQQALEVAKLADVAVLNDRAVNRLTALEDSIRSTQGDKNDPSSLAYDWEKTGIPNMIELLRKDMTSAKQAKLDKLHQQMTEAEALGPGEEAEKLRDRLRMRIRETEARTYLPMTVDQMKLLRTITAGTLHIIRNENKTVSLAKTEAVDSFAQQAGLEVLASTGNRPGQKFDRLRNTLTKYNLDMLGAKRVFRMLGGYTKNGQMEKLADLLNDGQLRQTKIIVEGTKLFDNVTGKENRNEMQGFAGPKAELVDIGLTDTKGRKVPLTHAQLCSLYMHLKNRDSRNHLLNGGLTLPDAELYHKGDIERAYQVGQTVQIGMLLDGDGTPLADNILNRVEQALTDYDRKWIKDMEHFFGRYTTDLINETSMKLVGFKKASVKNYYPIAVDRSQLAAEIEGVKHDGTIEGRGFLKNRVESTKAILLEECNSVVQRSLRDTAAYAGMAAAIRDANRILNADVETREGIGKLKSGIIKEHWGQDAANYIDYLLTDLQTTRRKRSDSIGRGMEKLRGNYAGAILTVNPGVAIAQAASLPTAGAVLGADTMAAVLPFVRNLSGKQRAALEAEIAAHGDPLLQYRMRGSQTGELSSIGVDKGVAQNFMDSLPKELTGWINRMDENTVAALWEGAKRYVQNHPETMESFQAVADGVESAPEENRTEEAYWTAVNRVYQRVIEETQPNYTVMQRAGIQRSDNEITKTLTMFTTQRFQNYGILADAVGDYRAQTARYKAEASAENRAEVDRAGQNLKRAAASQITQTAVFALMKIGADFLLHRWDREQDENGDVTAASVLKRFVDLFTESAAGNFLFGSEVYNMVGNAVKGTDYDVVSATNISAANDLFNAGSKLWTLLRKDSSGMDEEELERYHQKLTKAALDLIEYSLEITGVPAGNTRKMLQAVRSYAEDVRKLAMGEGFSFSGVPSSATGQYDRLYNAIRSGDAEEAQAALKKLEQMGKTGRVDSELKRRLKEYDEDVLTAAKARNEGDDKTRIEAAKRVRDRLYAAYGIAPTGKADAERRAWAIDMTTDSINSKGDDLLKHSREGTVYDGLTEALDGGRTRDIQGEIDRLVTAGKSTDIIKSRITGQVKSEYLAGNSYDREKLEKMLLALRADGKTLYTEKNFEDWVKQAKKAAANPKEDEWVGLR